MFGTPDFTGDALFSLMLEEKLYAVDAPPRPLEDELLPLPPAPFAEPLFA